MKTRTTTLSILAAAMGLACAVLPGQASAFSIPNHFVTQAQIDALQSGDSANDVIQALGAPEDTAKWMDGTQSLVYQTTSTGDGPQRVYVDLNQTGKMTGVEVLEP